MKIYRSLALGVTFGLAASMLAATAPQVGATGESILFVTSSATSVPPSDTALIDVIEAEGYNVVLGDDNTVTNADAAAVSAVVVSSSVVPSVMGNTFRTAATPVIAFEPFLFDDLGLTRSGGSNRGEVAGKKNVNIINATHPLAASLSGSVAVTTSNVGISWGRALAAADVIARVPGSSSQSAIFTYDAGDQMDGIVAPAARIALFPSYGTGAKLTPEGAALVIAAVDHAVAASGPPSNNAPAVDAGDDVTVGLGDPISVTGSVTDDGLPSGNVTISWTGPAGVSFGTPGAATTTVTVPGEGTYQLTLSADDGELTNTDTVTVTVIEGGPVDPGDGSILYIAATATGASSEQAAIQRLLGNGYSVTVADDNTVDPADAAAHDLVIVSASITPGRLSNAWANVATPMVVWEPFVFDNLDFTVSNTNEGAAGSQRNIAILTDTHPITAGFSGTVPVTTAGRALTWGKPQGAVSKLASHANTSTKIALFTYEAGAQMDDGVAPARRVGFFMAANSPQVMTNDGWTLFDRSIAWALTAPKPAPTASAGADITSGEAPQTVTFNSTGSTGDIVSYDWDFGDGSTGSGPTPSHTYVAGGSYTATLTVTDDLFQTGTATVALDFDNPPPVIGGDDPIARYDFVQGATNDIIPDTSGIGVPLDLTVENPNSIIWLDGGGIDIPSSARLQSSGPASKIIEAVKVTEAMTIEAWIDPQNITQSGPARIATLSNGVTEADNINVMLGQGYKFVEGDRLEGRFQTSSTTNHGQPGVLTQDAALDGDLAHVVFTREPNGIQRIYVNGSLSTEWTISGDVDVWDPTTPLVLANDTVASRPWRGEMHLVQIYDRALDETEVCGNAAQGPGRSIGSANIAPLACLVASDLSGDAPLLVNFDGAASSDLDGSITGRAWDFGDGTTSSSAAPSHTYAAPGRYVATLTVTDDDGATRSASITIEVTDPNSVAPTLQEKSGMRVGNGFFKEDLHVARETWLGRELNWTAQFTDHGSASDMGSSSNGLFTSNNAELPNVADRMNTSVSVGLAFGPTDLKNGGVPAVAINLQKTIDGEYDFLYYRVASRAVEGGYGDAVIRLGHEFNGKWAPWSSQGNEALFIEAWRHVHDLFQNVSPDFKYDWGGLKEGWNGTAPQAYPGDDYVDIVSQSIYWKKKTGFLVWSEALWNDRFIKPMNDARVFAAAHGKQVAYSEWGILQVDEPLFITRMHEWMTSLPADGPGSMAYNVYWDSSGTLNRLYQHPAVEARYKELFG